MFKDDLKKYHVLKNHKIIIRFLQLCPAVFMSSCSNAVILNSKGYVGSSEKSLIITAAALMLIVVLPAIVMTFLFAWQYRESNKKAKYTPEWKNSKILEIATWVIPSLIIMGLSILVWINAHKLDPYRPLQSDKKPIIIQVVSLDWKWLFIYPMQGIATLNQLVFPTNVPIHFYLTSGTVINSFFIPQLGSQIMTMAGMQTQLYLIANTPGTYDGISSNFSGPGFTGMRFKAFASSEKQFEDWVTNVKKVSKKLDQNSYMKLMKPSTNNPVEYFSSVQPDLFIIVINKHGQVANPSISQE
jgi:cytochrome o ubiquinol oxidase subunit II